MNAINVVIIGVLAVLIGGGFWFFTSDVPEDMMAIEKGEAVLTGEDNSLPKADDVMKKDDAVVGDDVVLEGGESMGEQETMVENGTYEAYDPSKLARAEDGDVVLFFNAVWCPTCRALNKNIEANSLSIPKGVTILDVNYDTATALKQKYGVTYQHTLVQVDVNGEMITKWSGSPTLAELVTHIN